MIDVALNFVVSELNTYLLARTGETFGAAQLVSPVNDTGRWAIPDDAVGVALINVDEERTMKVQVPEITYVNGRQVLLEPRLQINLDVLFAAQFKLYPQSLKFLSRVLTFFQAHPKFTSTDWPALDPAIETLVPELRALGFEQLNQLWAYIGGKYLPSVVYRMRLVTLQDLEPRSVGQPITTIQATLAGR